MRFDLIPFDSRMFRDGSYIDDGCARWVVKTWDTRMVGSGSPAAAAVAIAVMSVNGSYVGSKGGIYSSSGGGR